MSKVLKDLDPRAFSKPELDPRITYDKHEDKWTFKDDSTKEYYEFNPVLENWISMDFTTNDMTDAQKEILEKKRQKILQLKAEKLAKSQETGNNKPKPQTSIYVSNLPLDIDISEIKQHFGKFGVIAEDLLTGKAKIKLYQDDEGKFKGDALITYMKPESVDLAIKMLDDTSLRNNEEKIKVQKAEFKQKPGEGFNDTNNKNPNKRQYTDEDKKQIKKKLKALNDKIEDWNGEDDKLNPKWLRTVILKRVFTLKELQEDPKAKDEIIEDIRDGCEEIGRVERVVLFDQEEEGVVLVRFTNGDSAVKCIERMDGRYFSGQKLIATSYRGEQFHKSESAADRQHGSNTKEDEAEDEGARLESFISQNSSI